MLSVTHRIAAHVMCAAACEADAGAPRYAALARGARRGAIPACLANSATRDKSMAATVRSPGAPCIGTESPSVFAALTARLHQPQPNGASLLGVDGDPAARTQLHSGRIEWFEVKDVAT